MNDNITPYVRYIGADDKDLDLFESQYVVPQGISYNSYVITDEKIAVMDTIDQRKTEEWTVRLEEALEGRTPDYLIVQHMEPDHAANIGWFAEKYPEATIVASAKAIQMMPQFFEEVNFAGRTQTVKEGDTLCLGQHTLKFIMAPMVHWPEVMLTICSKYRKARCNTLSFLSRQARGADKSWRCPDRRLSSAKPVLAPRIFRRC